MTAASLAMPLSGRVGFAGAAVCAAGLNRVKCEVST